MTTKRTEMNKAYAAYLKAVDDVTKIIEAHRGGTVDPEDMHPDLWNMVEQAARLVTEAPITNAHDALLACACAADRIGELELTNNEEDDDWQSTRLFRKAFAAANIPLPNYLTNEIRKGNQS